MKHAPSVVIVSWHRSEHGNISFMYETYSVSCHRQMKTLKAQSYILKEWSMLRQLSSSHDNGQSMVIYHACIKHAPSFVMLSWQRSEHGDIYLKYETCSISCHRLMTTARAWLFIHKVWKMLRLLSSSHDNGQSMVIYPSSMIHAPSVMIVSWQRSEHGNIPLMYEACSVRCRRLITTDRSCLFILKVCNMLCQLSSSHDNGQSMVIKMLCMKHAPSVVIISWQRSEDGDTSLRYESCSVSCNRLMTTVRAWIYIIHIWNMLVQ